MDRAVYLRMDSGEATHWWFVARRKIISRVMEDLVAARPPQPAILEAGCGSGGNLRMLSSFGKVSAFEYDHVARQRAIAKTGLIIPFGALPDDIPLIDKKFDIICLFDVLEHVEQDEASLRVLRSHLNAGGVIFLTVPAFPALWSHHDVAHHHYRRYTKKSLSSVARNVGLDINRSFYFNSFLAPLAVTVRLVKSVSGKNSPDDQLPSSIINKVFENIFASERFLIGRVSMPFGLSLAAVLQVAA